MVKSNIMKKKAFILSIVLWIVAALLFGTVALATLSKDTLFLTRGLNDKLYSELIAEDILEILKFYITTAEHDYISYKNSLLKDINYNLPDRLIADGRLYELGKNIKIRLHNTSGMVNILNPNAKLIASLATTKTQRQERYTIEDSINDWVDSDNAVSLNGAEQSRYDANQDVNYKVRNSQAIQSIYEFKLIKGIKDLSVNEWNELKNRFYFGNSSVVNLAIVDAKFLSSVLNINLSKALDYIKLREDNLDKYMKLISSEKSFNEDTMGFYMSKQLKIEIDVVHGNARSILKTIIDFDQTKDLLYSTQHYELN